MAKLYQCYQCENEPYHTCPHYDPMEPGDCPHFKQQTSPRRVTGWLALFLILTVIGAVVTFFSTLGGLHLFDYYDESYGLSITYVLMGLDVLTALFVLLLSLYMAWSFVKRKPNAVFLGRTYVVYVLFLNSLSFIVGYGSPEQFSQGAEVLRSILWGIVWLLFLGVSKQVKALFPKPLRRILRRDWYILLTLIATPLITFSIVVTEMMRGEEQEAFLMETIDPASLPYDEYSDGYMAFKKLEGWACSQEVDEDSMTYFSLSLGDACSAILATGYEENFSSESFMDIVSNWSPDLEDGSSFEVLENKVEKNSLKKIYRYRARYDSAPAQLWSCVVVQDLFSPIVCVISFYQVDDAEVVTRNYLDELVNSVRFR